MFSFLNKFKYFDVALQIAIILLLLTGLALLYSTTISSNTSGVFLRQLVFVAIGVAGYLFFSFIDYHLLAKANRFGYVIFVILLLYLVVFGSAIRGGRRWITLGFFNFQPAEFVKLMVILGLARLLHLRRGQINSWGKIAWSLIYAGVPAGLIILEPDLGSALVILAVWAGILLMSPIKKKFLVVLLLIFLTVSGVTWKFFLKDFQKDRIVVFLDPALDPKGRGYNVRQATIAVGSGQIVGQGLGKGLQSQDKFLPEQQTDFIFAASSEQIGFLGDAALLGLYFFFFVRLIKITHAAKDDLGMYISAGVFFYFFTHVAVNVGMNIGLLPVTGIPLPFVSAGGSSLIAALIALGITQNIYMQSKALRF